MIWCIFWKSQKCILIVVLKNRKYHHSVIRYKIASIYNEYFDCTFLKDTSMAPLCCDSTKKKDGWFMHRDYVRHINDTKITKIEYGNHFVSIKGHSVGRNVFDLGQILGIFFRSWSSRSGFWILITFIPFTLLCVVVQWSTRQ